jgi:hypothetical protein
MGIIRLLNPFCTSATPPRKRTARAAEATAREAKKQTALLQAHLAPQTQPAAARRKRRTFAAITAKAQAGHIEQRIAANKRRAGVE